jgi:hypothetical protein
MADSLSIDSGIELLGHIPARGHSHHEIKYLAVQKVGRRNSAQRRQHRIPQIRNFALELVDQIADAFAFEIRLRAAETAGNDRIVLAFRDLSAPLKNRFNRKV